MNGSSRDALHFLGPRDVAIVAEPVAAPGSGELLVQTDVSAISPGTELLVYRGEAPSGIALDASIDGMRSAARFPLKYGYSTVGRVVALAPGVDEGWQAGPAGPGPIFTLLRADEPGTVVSVTRFDGVPPYAETRAYIDKVQALYVRYRAALGNPIERPEI